MLGVYLTFTKGAVIELSGIGIATEVVYSGDLRLINAQPETLPEYLP